MIKYENNRKRKRNTTGKSAVHNVEDKVSGHLGFVVYSGYLNFVSCKKENFLWPSVKLIN
jgi:hypothetical protein